MINLDSNIGKATGGDLKELLQFIMEGGSVVRYHTRPGIKPDTNAHHSHGVAMLCSILAGYEFGQTKASVTLLMAALTHDLSEQKFCDVSAPAKRLLGIGEILGREERGLLGSYGLDYEGALTDGERVVLHLADCFDGMLACCREIALGNRNAMLIWRRYCEYILQVTTADALSIDVSLRASNMFEAIKEIYSETRSNEGPNFDVFKSE